jgi:putative aldouronate transport system substrate-binding protein
MKKNIAVLLICLGLIAGLSSCKGSGSSSGGTGGTYKVTMMLLSNGTTPDVDEVRAAINEHIKDRGIEVEFAIMDWTFAETINLMVSGGEKLDLIPVWGWNLSNDVAQGKLTPLTKHLETVAAETARVVGADYFKATTLKGDIYAVPSLRDMAASYGVCLRKDILEKYGFTVDDIKTPEDLERIFTAVSQGEPELTMLYGQGNTNTIVEQMTHDWDGLSNDYGVLMNQGRDIPFKVVNLFETPEYEQRLRMVRNWYRKGWIVPDATTNPQGGAVQVGAGRLFSFASNLKPGFDQQSTLGAGGVQMVQADIKPALSTTGQVGVLNWAIPITCKNVEKTMEFLNLMYTDPILVNLIDWGIEGKHYVKIDDKVITYPPGVDASNTGYSMNLAWFYGNSWIAYVWEGNPPDINGQMVEFNRNAIFSKALGFTFDSAPVRNAVTSVANVAAEYRVALEFGMLDVDENLPKFIAALKAAGMDEIIAEKQRQLDAWAKENNLY